MSATAFSSVPRPAVQFRRTAAAAFALCLVALAALPTAAAAQVRSAPSAAEMENRYTPATLSVGARPNPVLGSDGRYHLVYELHVTNASPAPLQLESVEVLDATSGQTLLSLDANEVMDRMHPVGSRAPMEVLEPAQQGVVFLHLAVDSRTSIPDQVAHRVRISVPGMGIPGRLAALADLPAGATSLAELGGTTEVGPPDAVVLGPPLAGPRWVAADGCCTAVRHVRALSAVNTEFFLAQRFAIDWERLDEERRLFRGDRLDVESYFAYDEPVLAVADARVVRVIDGLPDQVPGELPTDITFAEADGNHIILELDKGVYALYAHLIPGSITVAEGDRVQRGQILARVGNSGNSSAPHLHFHLMESPASLGSEGLPYVIDEFVLEGRAPSTEAFDEAELHGTPLEIIPVDDPGTHREQLPLDQSLVTFPDAGSDAGAAQPAQTGSGVR